MRANSAGTIIRTLHMHGWASRIKNIMRRRIRHFVDGIRPSAISTSGERAAIKYQPVGQLSSWIQGSYSGATVNAIFIMSINFPRGLPQLHIRVCDHIIAYSRIVRASMRCRAARYTGWMFHFASKGCHARPMVSIDWPVPCHKKCLC